MAIEGLKDVLRSESTHGTKVDVISTVEEYVNQTDWRVNANSNSGGAATHPALINTSAGKIIANYWLDKVYSKAEGDAHRNGDYHIHDLDNLSGYCFTKDTKIKTVEYGDIAIEDLLAKGVDEFTVYSTDIAGEKVCLNYDLNLVDDARTRRYYGEDLSVVVKLHELGGHFKTCKARNLRKTRENAELVEVEFGGSHPAKVRCTPDHKFLVYDRRMNHITFEPYSKFIWVEARDLKPYMLTNACGFDGKPHSNLTDVVRYDGSTAWVRSVKPLEEREDVYCMEVEDTHCFALENGTIAHNCCGHDLAKLLNEGFNGVVGRVGSKPPKHVREALNQMANYIGILQAEWAGAQAFSSFDTYLAPLVFFDSYYDGMTYDDLKKAVRNFVYNLNVPSRWGQCVPSSYKALRADGKWVSYDELKVGDEIYVVDMKSGSLKKDSITHLNEFDAPTVMHKYSDKNGFSFQITPNHRVIYKTDSNEYRIDESSKLIGQIVDIPISSWNDETFDTFCGKTFDTFCGNDYPISDEMLELIAYIMVDGRIVQQEGETPIVEVCESALRWGYERFEEICETLKIQFTKDKQNDVCCYRINDSSVVDELISLIDNVHTMPKWFSALSPRQVYKFLDTWVLLNGHFDGSQWELRAAGGDIQEMLAYLTIKAGKGAALMSSVADDNGQKTRYSIIYKRGCRSCEITEASPITDKVWCPTTNTGTFICMTDEGYIFLTGNSPFSNVTIDLKCPKDLRERTPMRDNLPFFVSVYNDLKESIDKGKELYEKHGEKTIAELSKLPEDEKHLMQIYDGWQRLMAEAQSRLNDYESDDETLCYSLTYNCFQKEMEDVMRAYYEVMSEGDAFGLPFTFPIPTVNITEDFDWDNPRYDILWDNTAKYGCSYFQNFCGSQYLRDENGELTIRNENAYSPDDVRSMCPLTFDTKVVARSGQDASFRKIGEMYHSSQKGTKYECFYNGQWVKCSVIRVEPQPIHRITLANNRTYSMGELHEQPICRNGETMNVLARDIRVGDLIPFNTNIIDSEGTESSYLLGYAVGAYLGDGSHDSNGTVSYSLCADEKDDETEKYLRAFWEGNGFHTNTKINGRLRSFVVTGSAFALISKFIVGKTALDKGIAANILNQSVEMRQGIVDGYIATDGQRISGRISTSSERMVEDLIMLFNSLGIKAYKTYTDSREGRLGENPNMMVSHITKRANHEGKYTTIDGQLYWYVTNVEVKANTNIPLYCLETESEEHLFVLGDGLITHNCRLQLDKREVKKRGGGLFGSDSQTGSIGVVTINLARIGYLFKGDEKGFMKRLFKLMDYAKNTLEKKRKFIKEMVLRGLYPYTRRYITSAKDGFTTFFSTIGINGMNEAIRNFTNDEHDITDKEGQEFALRVTTAIRERLTKYQEETGNIYNLEASPAEGTTYRFAKEDAKRYGSREVHYIICDKHGKVEVEVGDEETEIECPLCKAEEADDNSTKEK